MNHFARDLALEKPLLVYDHTTWRPYCHIEDISDAIIRVLEYPKDLVAFEVFNVGGNSMNHSKEQIVDLVRESVPSARRRVSSRWFRPQRLPSGLQQDSAGLGFFS